MPTPNEIMAERKEVVRRAIEASDRGDRATYEKLQNEALALLLKARELRAVNGEKLTTKDAYGLMGS